MPYHTHRRTDCNIAAARPGMAAERESLAIPSGREHADPRSGTGLRSGFRHPREVSALAVQHQVRNARTIHIDPYVTEGSTIGPQSGRGGPLDASGSPRPAATPSGALTNDAIERRDEVGRAVLAVRAPVRGHGPDRTPIPAPARQPVSAGAAQTTIPKEQS